MSKFEMMKNPLEYIEHLQMANRARREQQSVEQQKREEIVKKEQNFQLFFSGANDARARDHRTRGESKSPACTKPSGNYAEIHRKKWGKPQVPLLLKEHNEEPPKPKPEAKLLIRKPPRQAQHAINQHEMRRSHGARFMGMARPATSSVNPDTYDLVTRTERLSEMNKRRLYQFLNQLEAEQGL